jgi:glucose/arabinose dehydrogenase
VPPPASSQPDPLDDGLTLPPGFQGARIATVGSARELAATPNGDLLVGTLGGDVYIVPDAEGSGAAGAPQVFATTGDGYSHGVAVGGGYVYIGTQYHVWRVPYTDGDRTAQSPPQPIADVRSGGGGGHITTSVAFAGGVVYASVGSSCNSCVESDPTRATILRMAPDGSGLQPKAVRWRNAIALGVNPDTGTLWASGAEQDSLPLGHPYEPMDAVTAREGVVDYGWPDCYENGQSANGVDCSQMPVARVALPAYSTAIGIGFYGTAQCGAYRFPPEYRGGAFVALHGSWHGPDQGLPNLIPPRLIYVPMSGDTPSTAVNWNDSSLQWSDFIGGFQDDNNGRRARPTGVAIGPQGSLFVADDLYGGIYRIRPQAP